MKQNSWISIVFSFASQCRGKIALSVLCAIISVVAGLIPYWSVYQIITLFIGGSPVMAEVWKWCWIGLGAYAIRFLLYGISTSLSHISAYTILENIRLTLAQRLMKAPLGTVIGESVGKLKSVLVDRVETIELPLAHMIPECISNLLLPVAVFVYLVCIDWRMALAMLVTVPLAFIAFAMMMKNFNKLYADYMESNNYVNGVIVEYVERGENTVQEVMLDLQSGNIHYYVSYLKDIVDEECDLSVRAGVLMERLKAYEPELPKDMEPMVYVNYCEKSELGNPRCQKLSDLDSRTVEQDKAWYADRDPNTNEPKTTAQMFFTVYYAEKGDKMLHHFKGKIDIGTGNGGLLSQLKLQNEMRLTDESWINYQKGKGNEEFQKYMEDLTDMQNHVLPYLQSFCSLEEKGVQERREQQVAEKNESREAVPRAGVETNTAVKDAGKVERKAVAQKKTMPEKEKKPSIHERLEINKRIIQEKQGKDKPERGADLGVRTV